MYAAQSVFKRNMIMRQAMNHNSAMVYKWRCRQYSCFWNFVVCMTRVQCLSKSALELDHMHDKSAVSLPQSREQSYIKWSTTFQAAAVACTVSSVMPCGGVPGMRKSWPPLLRIQGCQWCCLISSCKPGVEAAQLLFMLPSTAMNSAILISACLVHLAPSPPPLPSLPPSLSPLQMQSAVWLGQWSRHSLVIWRLIFTLIWHALPAWCENWTEVSSNEPQWW